MSGVYFCLIFGVNSSLLVGRVGLAGVDWGWISWALGASAAEHFVNCEGWLFFPGWC